MAKRKDSLSTLAMMAAAAPAPARSKREAARRLKEADERLGEELSLRELNELTHQAEIAVGAPSDESAGRSVLTGEELASVAEMQRIRHENLRRAFAVRRTLLADTLAVAQVAELLGGGRQTPHDRRKAKSLLAARDKGQWRFPSWQFDPNGPDGVVAGLPEVLRELRGSLSDLARVSWFITPKPLLGGRTPLDALQAGEVEDVVAEARSVGAS